MESILIIVLVTCVAPGRTQATNEPNAALLVNGNNFTCAVQENSTSSAFYITYENILLSRTEGTNQKYLDFQDRQNFIFNNSDSFNFDPIFDDRWESFPIYWSLREKTHEIRNGIFFLSLSIWQIENIVIVFNNDNTEEQLKFVIKKEQNNLIITLYNNRWKLHSSKINNVISVDWFHITIAKYSDRIELREISSTDCFQYAQKSVSLKNFQIISDSTIYKIHNYTFTQLINSSNWVNIANNLKPEKYLCISLDVAMCEKCTFRIGIQSVVNNTMGIIKSVTENGKSNEIKWMRFRIENETFTENFNLLVHGDYLPTAGENLFWFFDNLRMCNPDETRYVSVKRNYTTISCKALYHPRWVINNKENSTSEVNCMDPQYVGPQCDISCPETTKCGHCNVKKVCYSVNGESECHCGIGYMGKACEQQEASLNLTRKWMKYEVLLSWLWPYRKCNATFNFTIDILKTHTDIREDNKQLDFQYKVPFSQSKLNYSYKIPTLPHSTSYKISVWGIYGNSSINIVVAPNRPELNEDVKATVLTPENNILVTVPSIKNSTRSTKSYMCIVVGLSQYNKSCSCAMNSSISDLFPKDFWIAASFEPKESPFNFTLGDNNLMKSNLTNDTVENKPLNTSLLYSFTLVAVNVYKNKKRCSFYSFPVDASNIAGAMNSHMNSSSLYALLLLLVLPVMCWIIYKYLLKGKMRKNESHYLYVESTTGNLLLSDSSEIVSIDTQRNSAKFSNVQTDEKYCVIPTHLVPLDKFESYVKQTSDEIFTEQHSFFQKGNIKSWDYGTNKNNKPKNRYKNLCAYDFNRVILEKINEDEFSDYINASYIDGYQQNKAYIATQGPKLSTIYDFWRMICQENVQYIVMVTNLVEDGTNKCEKYWPDSTNIYGDIKVTFLDMTVHKDYISRNFEIINGNERKKILHLQFISWPNYGVPVDPLYMKEFMKELNGLSSESAPIVVHCSAGVGRTGTIILSLLCLKMAEAEKKIDVLLYLKMLREQRANMVDNVDQYKLVHFLLLELLCTPDYSVRCDKNTTKNIDKLLFKHEVENQMNFIESISWRYDAILPTSAESGIIAKEKNRFSSILPKKVRICLNSDGEDYINAVPVDGFKFRDEFIVTQIPLPGTLADFWRMIQEKNVKLIVSLNVIPKEDQTCCQYWPIQNEMKITNNFSIQHLNTQENPQFCIYSCKLQDGALEDEEENIVQIIQFNNWLPVMKLPNRLSELIDLWETVDKLSTINCPLVVTCHDGVTACGFFVAISYIIENMKLNKNIDVCTAVRVIRKNRNEFISDKVQFNGLYKIALEYHEREKK